MHDIIVTDIPQKDYDWLCEEAAKLGITADDYLGVLVKDYAKELRAKDSGTNEPSD